jgi:hypothetical protein
MPFVKLDCKILYSSIWAENSDTCKIWITLLAMADSNGMVSATAPGISRISCVDLMATEQALSKFEMPDEYSKSQDDGGRRIRRVDGGYLVLNYDKYRELDHTAAARNKRYRDKLSALRRNDTLADGSYDSVSISDSFILFWKEYPRKIGKHNAGKAFKKLNPDKELFDKIIFSLCEQKRYWSDPQYIPYPATWLNGKRWEDERKESMPHHKSFGGYIHVERPEPDNTDPVEKFLSHFPEALLPIKEYFQKTEFDDRLIELFANDDELNSKFAWHLKQHPESDERLYRKNYLYGKYGIPEME